MTTIPNQMATIAIHSFICSTAFQTLRPVLRTVKLAAFYSTTTTTTASAAATIAVQISQANAEIYSGSR